MNPVMQPLIDEPVDWPVLQKDTPIIYEDEEDEANDMGEAYRHRRTNVVVEAGVTDHLRERRPKLRALANMNCYYAPGPLDPKTGSRPYISADVMVVDPFEPLSDDLTSYTIGRHGPSPLSAIEVLSKGNAETNDKGVKVRIYADLKIGEYILVDPTGDLLAEKLLLKQLQPDGSWNDVQDDDGGVTSKLGFRLILDETDQVAVVDVATGKRYASPYEANVEAERADAEAKARRAAEKQARVAAKRAEAEAKRAEAEAKRAEAEAKRAEAEAKRAEAETIRAETETIRAETEAKRADLQAEACRQAEESSRHADERARQAEEQMQAMRAELDRLREKKEPGSSGDGS